MIRQGDSLPDETQVLYVSPLKALANDVRMNLLEPLAALRLLPGVPEIRAAVRTGDTPQSERQAMLRKPPHILVTTPESFYLLLTSGSGRGVLGTVRTVIVDEIHAVAATSAARTWRSRSSGWMRSVGIDACGSASPRPSGPSRRSDAFSPGEGRARSSRAERGARSTCRSKCRATS